MMDTQAEFAQKQVRAESAMALEVCRGCTACALRCASDVPASRAEWESLQNHIALQDAPTQARISTVQQQDKTVDLGDDVSVEMCRYWDTENSLCAVYPVRPLACRLLGHVEWMPCPVDKVPHALPLTQSLELMQSYAHFERKTFAQWEAEVVTAKIDASERSVAE